MLKQCYELMADYFGPCHWWPGQSPFEVAVGAVLTQNTSWKNVEKAIALLYQEGVMSPYLLWHLPREKLEECLRPSGFFRLKAVRLRNLIQYFAEAVGQEEPDDDPALTFLQSLPTEQLRSGLLGVKGIGPETADSILLYALNRPVFVVDAYTYRIMNRHGIVPEDVTYHEMQDIFMSALPTDVALYNEYHALLVRTGNMFCKKSKPLCSQCPLGVLFETGVCSDS